MLRSALLASACGLSFAVPGRTDGNAHTLSAPVPQGETYSQWIENLMASPQSSPQRDVIQASGSFVLGLKGGFVDELGVARTSDGVPAAPYMGCGDELGDLRGIDGKHSADGGMALLQAEAKENLTPGLNRSTETAPSLAVVRCECGHIIFLSDFKSSDSAEPCVQKGLKS